MGSETTTMRTLAFLYGWFCERPGFPTTLVSDNGPQFTSKDFADKMVKWGIKHILTPPYHPASNGLAERGVGTLKSHLKKMNSQTTPSVCTWIYRPYSATTGQLNRLQLIRLPLNWSLKQQILHCSLNFRSPTSRSKRRIVFRCQRTVWRRPVRST